MLIQFQNMRGRPTLGGTSDQPSALRGGAISPRNSIQLRADPPRLLVPVASSRGEEMTTHQSFLSRCGAALRDVAAIAAAILFIAATGIGFTVAIYLLLFVRF